MSDLSFQTSDLERLSEIIARDHFPARPRAQSLERGQGHAVAQEAHVAVGEGEVGTMHVAAAEGALPIKQRGGISVGRHPVVDRCSAVKHDVSHDPRRPCDPTPLPDLSDGSYTGLNIGYALVVCRITMVALAEEEGVSGAVGYVRNANAAVNPENAVPRYAGKSRCSANRNRACAGVAAITAHPIE